MSARPEDLKRQLRPVIYVTKFIRADPCHQGVNLHPALLHEQLPSDGNVSTSDVATWMNEARAFLSVPAATQLRYSARFAHTEVSSACPDARRGPTVYRPPRVSG